MTLLEQLQQDAREKLMTFNGSVHEFLDSLIKHVLEEGTRAMVVEEVKLPKRPCINAENHLFGSCFECEKAKGHNAARTEQLHCRAQILGNE